MQMRVGIVGAGPAGLTLASVLSREAKKGSVVVEVFERGAEERDQGSGWDLSKTAQDALTRAGVDVPSVQRHGSDTMRMYKLGQKHPQMCLRMPSMLKMLGLKKDHILEGLNPETERNEIINRLIAQLGSNVKVQHNCPIAGARRSKNEEEEGKIELLKRDGSSLGTFDVLVDASGVAAALRHSRFSPKADAFYTGTTFVQGMVVSPEKSWAKEIVAELGEGSWGVGGPNKSGEGYLEIFAQRYGAKPEDQMVNLTIRSSTEGPNDIASQLGLEGFHGLTRDKMAVEKVKAYCLDQLSHEAWPQNHRDAFNAIEAIRILPIFMHPMKVDTMAEALPNTDDLPMIGIGDALHALPPWSGMSGNYALTDASDLATALLAEIESWNASGKATSLAAMLREQESKFLTRADGPRERCIRVGKFQAKHASTTKPEDYDFVDHILGGQSRWSIEAICTIGFLKGMTLLNWLEGYGINAANK